MSASNFITETWLREQFGLAHGSEIHLPADARLTPSASQLLAERNIRTKYINRQGRVFVKNERLDNVQLDGKQSADTDAANAVHPLTGGNQRPGNTCAVCGSSVAHKGELLTLLDNELLVPKTHPRIALRGKLDSLIAQTVWVQTQFDADNKQPQLHRCLADLRSYMGNLLRSEVTGEALPPLQMAGLDDAAIHNISHQPLKHLDHDHIVPERSHGNNVALLNLLRANVREVELVAAQVFTNAAFELSRKDLITGLNRLSSALYVLMLITVLGESGTDITGKVEALRTIAP